MYEPKRFTLKEFAELDTTHASRRFLVRGSRHTIRVKPSYVGDGKYGCLVFLHSSHGTLSDYVYIVGTWDGVKERIIQRMTELDMGLRG